MYFRIALNNVKKSIKDYSVYFLTLTFAVCIFYTFNSIDSQKAMFDMNSSQLEMIDILNNLIGGVSVFVSVILGSLIVYANNFLIKRRKKELGIYMTLGMSKKKISTIFLVETLIVGLISLIIGLLLGIVISQGLSVFTGKLFDVSMSEYKFVFSISAVLKTTMYFGLIYLLVMLFNTRVIAKYKLIDLLNASRKNESIKIKNPIIALVIFILSIICLGFAYYYIEKVGLNPLKLEFKISIVLGILGTGFFFYGLAGFILYLVQKNKNIYLKKLNIFVMRQINSKINTNFISMTVICLMIFITIGMLSSGLSFKAVLEADLDKTTPFDATAQLLIYGEDLEILSAKEALKMAGINEDKDVKIAEYNEYSLGELCRDILKNYTKDTEAKALASVFENYANGVKLSEYNKILELQGKSPITLEKDEVLVTSNYQSILEIVDRMVAGGKIKMLNKEFNIKNKETITDSLESTGFNDNRLTIILPDNYLEGKVLHRSIANIDFPNDKYNEYSKEYGDIFSDIMMGRKQLDTFLLGYTKQGIIDSNKGMTTTILFIGIYLGIVFLISSAAVLALQQLTEASDSLDRYKILKKIGADKKLINKSIFIQTLIFFAMPLLLAIVHSIVGIDVVNEFISIYNKPDIGSAALVTTCILFVVYGGYFYATYVGYKNIVNRS